MSGEARERRDTRRARRARRRISRERQEGGQASLELLGAIPVLVLVALAGVQLGIVAYAASQAGTAARSAARTASQRDAQVAPQDAGRRSVSGWLSDGTAIDVGSAGDAVTAKATVDIPSLIPGVDMFGPVVRTAEMPKE